jgi:thioredoxin reductase
MSAVVVVGGGPAGLACATALRGLGVGDVLVLEREARPGGIPRHAAHQGFGLRDVRRALPGPRYAERWVAAARRAGAEIRTETMATGWTAAGALEVTSPHGRETLRPDAVVLATGCRERPRAARLVPGSRPDGVMTTGMLQRLVYLHSARPGRRALIVGAEHVSFSALLTLAHGGTEVAGMATELPRHQTLGAFRAGAALRWRTPVWTRTAVTAIEGTPRVEAVELTDLRSGRSRRVACDTVVFTADWIPDHELAVMGGAQLDPGTRGPRVDAALRTSRPRLFAAGNLLHGAETADVAALEGRHAAAAVAAALRDDQPWAAPAVPLACAPPLRWVAPNAVAPDLGPPPLGRFALRAGAFLRLPAIEVRQDGRRLWAGRLPRLVPGRTTRLPHAWSAAVDPAGGEIRIAVVRSRYGARP